MTRFLLKLTLIMTFVLTITSLVVRTLGSTQPPNPALRGFIEGCEDKPQPCWYGIIVGETLIEDVIGILNQKGYSTSQILDTSSVVLKQLWQATPKENNQCHVDVITTIPMWTDATQTKMIRSVEQLILRDCPQIYLGDLFTVLKNPATFYDPSSCRPKSVTFAAISLNDWRLTANNPTHSTPFVPQDTVDNLVINLYGDLYTKVDNDWYGSMFLWKIRRMLWSKYCSHG